MLSITVFFIRSYIPCYYYYYYYYYYYIPYVTETWPILTTVRISLIKHFLFTVQLKFSNYTVRVKYYCPLR